MFEPGGRSWWSVLRKGLVISCACICAASPTPNTRSGSGMHETQADMGPPLQPGAPAVLRKLLLRFVELVVDVPFESPSAGDSSSMHDAGIQTHQNNTSYQTAPPSRLESGQLESRSFDRAANQLPNFQSLRYFFARPAGWF